MEDGAYRMQAAAAARAPVFVPWRVAPPLLSTALIMLGSNKVETHCAISGRVLWSESEENLAQKLIAKLQQTQ